MVDIVVTGVKPNERGLKENKYGQEVEGKLDPEAITEIRYRDGDVFNYFFRSIEKFAPGFNKIFLVVEQEDQIPEGLNTNNTKLEIVYHRDFIPEELLPTYNITQIEMFFCNIKKLSNNYLYFNDDMLLIKAIDENFFVKNDLPNLGGAIIDNKPLPNIDLYYKMLNNCLKLENKYIKGLKNGYQQPHFCIMHNKFYEQEILQKYYKEIIDHYKDSHFRTDKNLTQVFYNDLTRYYKKCNYIHDMYKDIACYYPLRNNSDFKFDNKVKIVCFNDSENLDFKKVQSRYKSFLNSILPERSSFEL